MDNISWLTDQGAKILVDHLLDGIYVVEEGRLTYANNRIAQILGYKSGELIGLPFIELVADKDKALIMERYKARLSGESVPEQYDIHFVTSSGKVVCCALNICLLQDQKGNTVTIGSARDVTRQRAELEQLEATQLELQSIFDQLPDVFYRTNMQGIITMISPSCFDVLGYRQETMIGTAMAQYYVTPEDRQKVVQAIVDGGGKAIRVEAGLRHKDGSTIWISTNAVVRLGADDKPVWIEGVARDISERKVMEDQLTALTRIDGLTGAYNRRYFLNQSEAALEMMKRYQRPASMMMMDLDYFKNINDQYGHHIGDLALIAFTQACRKEIRESDVLGRLGGEEFALILPETQIEKAQILAERIRMATSNIAIPCGDQTIGFTVSIGLVEFKSEDSSMDSIMHRADLAMYQAKEKGRNQVVTAL